MPPQLQRGGRVCQIQTLDIDLFGALHAVKGSEGSMKFDDIRATRHLMKPIDILCDNRLEPVQGF